MTMIYQHPKSLHASWNSRDVQSPQLCKSANSHAKVVEHILFTPEVYGTCCHEHDKTWDQICYADIVKKTTRPSLVSQLRHQTACRNHVWSFIFEPAHTSFASPQDHRAWTTVSSQDHRPESMHRLDKVRMVRIVETWILDFLWDFHGSKNSPNNSSRRSN